MLTSFLGILPVLLVLAIIALPFVITAVKKRRQLGRVWSRPVSATLRIAGKELCCHHCGQTKFQKREGILVTSWIAFWHWSCWNQSAACYTCVECGHVEWFVRAKEENVAFTRNDSVGQ